MCLHCIMYNPPFISWILIMIRFDAFTYLRGSLVKRLCKQNQRGGKTSQNLKAPKGRKESVGQIARHWIEKRYLIEALGNGCNGSFACPLARLLAPLIRSLTRGKKIMPTNWKPRFPPIPRAVCGSVCRWLQNVDLITTYWQWAKKKRCTRICF